MTSRNFPYELGFLKRAEYISRMPGQKPDSEYGIIGRDCGVEMPESGLFYVVEVDPKHVTSIRIVAYADKYGRMFATDRPETIPPARYPRLCMFMTSRDAGEEGIIELCDDRGATREACRFACPDWEWYPDRVAAVSVSAAAGCDEDYLKRPRRLASFMAAAYMAFVETEPLFSPVKPFDLGSVFERFSTSDVFDAVNREVLEAETLWADHPESAAGIERYLVHMLRETGIVGMSAEDCAVGLRALELPPDSDEAHAATTPDEDDVTDGPHARLVRTAQYSDTYYVDFFFGTQDKCVEDGLFKAHGATWRTRCMLLGVESALNRFLILAEYLGKQGSGVFAEGEGFCARADRGLCESVLMQAPHPAEAQLVAGRWDTHAAFARACESLRLPYRIAYDYTTNEACDAFAVRIACPPAELMPATLWDSASGEYVASSVAERAADEASYAARMAILAAACAFSASAGIQRAAIVCTRADVRGQAILWGHFDRERFCAAFEAGAGEASAAPFAFLQAQGAHFDVLDGGLLPIEPLVGIGIGEFAGTFERVVAKDQTCLNDRARELAGVPCPAKLAIYEDARRREAAAQVCEALDGGVEAAVECIKGVHDRTENLMLRRICTGLLTDFSLGIMGDQSYLEVREAFLDPYGFRPLMTHASALMAHDDPKALAVLEELLDKVEAVDAFRDSKTACYRFFDSYETRLIYAKRCSDDANGRAVLPLPEEAYLVHDALAQAMTSAIAGNDEALAHAQKCIELAPARASSYLRAARAYFMMDDYGNEMRLCCKALEMAWDVKDAALALYWMAYAFWRLDSYDAAVACYRRCIALNSVMSEQAAIELEELLESVRGLQRHTFDEETALLEREGVPIRALRENAEFLLEVAKESVDSGAIALGCIVAAPAQRIVRDDALLPTVRSLSNLWTPEHEEGARA